MKKLVLLLILIPNLVMAEYICYEEYETKDLRKESLNFIISKMDKDYISKIEIPPPYEIKKMDALYAKGKEFFSELFSNQFYPAYEVQKQFSKIKETSRYSDSEMLNLLKFSMNMQEMKEDLYLYKDFNPTSDLERKDISYSFAAWNAMIIDMGECAVK